MTKPTVNRKWAAILSADVKGYSRLMEDDEVDTIRTLRDYRERMVKHIREHNGRVVDSPGDNLLSEFVSIHDAVQCAVEIQQELRIKNEMLPQSRRMEFRMGINLGDVIIEGDRIYGEGINIAARLEATADGGGICISGSAFDQVHNKLPMGFEYLGMQNMKNIAEPIRVYRVMLDSPEGKSVAYREKNEGPRHLRRRGLVFAIILCLIVAGFLYWKYHLSPEGHPVKPLSSQLFQPRPTDRPSIAVMPFTNISEDPEQEYFSDGMTDDLITDLSKISGLFVISRNSVFTYKDQTVKIEEIAKELGVRMS